MWPRLPRHLLAARPWRSGPGRLLHRALDAAGWCALDREVLLGILQDEAHAAALKQTVKGLRDRASRLEARAERSRGALLEGMETVGLQKLQLPEATLSAGRGKPDLVVTDEVLVPLCYRKADPRVELAWHGLMRGAALLASSGQDDAADALRVAAAGLMGLFSVDKKAIQQALKGGETVPGTAISNGAPTLTVRTR
jgi:hypothetical protein